jgi:hypothetical protein
MGPVVVGLAMGAIVTIWVGHALRSNAVFMAQLYQVTPHQLSAILFGPTVILAIAGTVCILPSLRAASARPISFIVDR